MAKFHLYYFSLVLVTVIAENSLGFKRSSSDNTISPKARYGYANVYPSCLCGEQITVYLRLRNWMKPPYFEYGVTIAEQPQRELIYFLEIAANIDPVFKYCADFYATLGYFVTTINGVSGSTSDNTSWEIIDFPSGNSINLGVSSYVVTDAEIIMFNFTTWDKTHS